MAPVHLATPQMGLRLTTPDGRRITHVSRWVLRCSACFFVTKVRLLCFNSCRGRRLAAACATGTMDCSRGWHHLNV
jgi:rRNA maturation endonuclease Nob1